MTNTGPLNRQNWKGTRYNFGRLQYCTYTLGPVSADILQNHESRGQENDGFGEKYGQNIFLRLIAPRLNSPRYRKIISEILPRGCVLLRGIRYIQCPRHLFTLDVVGRTNVTPALFQRKHNCSFPNGYPHFFLHSNPYNYRTKLRLPTVISPKKDTGNVGYSSK